MSWEPRSLAQWNAITCSAEILLFGGAAGALKSETLLADAAQERENPRLRAILFRRTFPELERTLILRSRELYSNWGGIYHEQKKRWRFPSGATIQFGYLDSESDVFRQQGAEYSFIGFDESTHFTELPLRYMVSRLRAPVGHGLRLRIRWASNPGNVGHAMHKAMFMGPTCTHCRTLPESRLPWTNYRDARWPSDGRPVGLSTCFIPGRVTDHSLLGSDYLLKLESLGGAFRKALLEGCWDVYEGQYFDCWDPARAVVKRALIPVEPWWPHWVAVDYGFNVSQAVAYLFARSPATPEFPEGRTYVLDELTARHLAADAFGVALRERWGDQRIQGFYLSPDAWQQRGTGLTVADQIVQSSRFGFQPAEDDRIGGAMLLYTQLANGRLVIADGCRQLLEAIPTRIHDPARPDDILKVRADPHDDCIDAVRYGVYTWVGAAHEPEALRIAGQVTSLDGTIAAIQRRLAEERLQGGQSYWERGRARP